jgi:hypothetical protein
MYLRDFAIFPFIVDDVVIRSSVVLSTLSVVKIIAQRKFMFVDDDDDSLQRIRSTIFLHFFINFILYFVRCTLYEVRIFYFFYYFVATYYYCQSMNKHAR